MLNADLFGNNLPVINSDGWPPDYEEQFWQHYRHRRGKGAAMKKLAAVRKTGVSFGLILNAVDQYFADLDARRARNQWCPDPAHPATWLHQQRWKDEYSVGESNGKTETYSNNGQSRLGYGGLAAKIRARKSSGMPR